MPSLIEITDVSFSREDKAILNSINLNLSEGTIGIIGANGSGKSTLARLIAGLIECDSGSIRIDGIDPHKERKKTMTLIGMIFQNPDHQIIFPTVSEEIGFGLRQLDLSDEETEKRVRDILLRFDADSWYDRNVFELSDGQRHLICLMAVLVMQPNFIIFDEPYTGLDAITTARLHRLLQSLDEQVILISHDLEKMTQYDRVIWLHHGQIRENGTAVEVISNYQKFVEEELNANA